MSNGEQSAFRQGSVAMLPVLVGVVPFALVAGLAGVANGLSVLETAAFSLLTYAGAAQIAALELFGRGAPLWVAIGTAVIINLRFAMYSAALAPQFRDLRPSRRLLSAFLIVDHAYAVASSQFHRFRGQRQRNAYYLGACAAFWVTWQVCALIGSLAGVGLAGSPILRFALPLSFLALLVPHLRARPAVVAALVGAIVAVVFSELPANLGMLAGALSGIVAGLLVEPTPEDQS